MLNLIARVLNWPTVPSNQEQERIHAREKALDAPSSEGGPSGPTGPETRINWPAECIEAEQRFGVPHARLFPLIGHEVITPSGRGVLIQVFPRQVTVKVGDTIVYVLPEQVMPIGTARKDILCMEGEPEGLQRC